MNWCRLVWADYRLFSYEKELALREVQTLLPGPVEFVHDGLRVPFSPQHIKTLSRLTYFAKAILPDGNVIIPDQARLEASARTEPTQRSRQSTRYSAHGLHEYKGKFNPQVVRAIANLMSLDENEWILDPFCGSGTTLLEGAHSGWNAVGTDLNPLAIKISNAKIMAVKAPTETLEAAAETLIEVLLSYSAQWNFEVAWTPDQINTVLGPQWLDRLPNKEYLLAWFPISVLPQLSLILAEIDRVVPRDLREVFQIIVSDLVRQVSLQDPGDLRIRRRKDAKDNYPVIPMFLEELRAKLLAISRAKAVIGTGRGYQQAFQADNRSDLRRVVRNLPSEFKGFDAVITSPPYVSALPYIDTQRLSLAILGLISSREIMSLERALTGTREIADRQRKELEARIATNPDQHLPKSVVDLCRQMLSLSYLPGNGFRRQNVPALTYAYFVDMAKMFRNVLEVTRKGAVFGLVVGLNRTELGGEKILIDTPQLLADVACVNGWRLKEIMRLETYHRFDMHSKNSITRENLLLLEKP